MTNDEKILLILGGIALVALLVFKWNPGLLGSGDVPIPSSSVQDTPGTVAGSIDPNNVNPNGPWYLSFAQRYLWAAPVSMYIPGVTDGQIGQDPGATAANRAYSDWAVVT